MREGLSRQESCRISDEHEHVRSSSRQEMSILTCALSVLFAGGFPILCDLGFCIVHLTPKDPQRLLRGSFTLVTKSHDQGNLCIVIGGEEQAGPMSLYTRLQI